MCLFNAGIQVQIPAWILALFQFEQLLFMLDLFMPYFCLKVQFDVTFPAVPCSLLSLDAMDISGEQHLDIVCTASSVFLLINF